MRFFFNQVQTETTIADKNALDNWMSQMVEKKTGEIKPNALFIGELSETKFKLELKRLGYNAFRPVIYGEISNGKLIMRLGLNRPTYIFLGIGNFMALLAIIKSGSWTFLTGAIVWTLLWYFMGWLFFAIEKKKTMAGIEKIIRVCA